MRTDGGLKTGWDVVIAALLGAEEYGFGSVAMIAEGCIMARVCHTNKCPVGVATQKEELRKRFKGIPENVVNFFLYIAEEVRQIMSSIGVSNMEELIGNQEFLSARNIGLPKTSNIDLSSLVNNECFNHVLSVVMGLVFTKEARSILEVFGSPIFLAERNS